MLTEDLKKKITISMNVQEYMSNKYIPTDKEWEKYFIDTYSKSTLFKFDENDFVSFEVFDDFIMIYDIISAKNGPKLLRKLIEVSEKEQLPIRCNVHMTNYRVLNVLMRRWNFKIIKVHNNEIQYVLERSI